MTSPHIPVLKNEVLEQFKNLDNGYIIDCTLGYGGHTKAILEANSNIKIIANDQDEEALKYSKEFLNDFKDRVIFQKGRFSNILNNHKDKNIVGILADIGVSSLQLDNDDRGFRFSSSILDMRMDQNADLCAKQIINEYPKEKLEYIFKEYGEVGQYEKLASVICEERENKEIISSYDLENLVLSKFENASRKFLSVVFQAIRIEVNNELGEISKLLEAIEKFECNKTIVAIICFHSLEDKIVKDTFRRWKQQCLCSKDAIICECGGNNSKGKTLTKKPITASKEELKMNHRSKSSKMRVFRFN